MSIILKSISFSYPEKRIFENFSAQFNDGVFYSVSAPSGKGKTTLFRIISGLEKVSSGKVEVNGKLAYMFQEDRLFPHLTVLENVKLAESKEYDAEEILEKLGLKGENNAYPDELSGGMRRRVALCRTLLAPSQNIILDEPFTGLDEETRDRAISLIADMCKSKTLLLSTHDEAEKVMCKEHILL